MTDTEILDDILEWLKQYALDLKPVAPSSAQYAVRYIERCRKERRVSTESPAWFPTYTPEQHCAAGHPLLCTIQLTHGAPAYVCPHSDTYTNGTSFSDKTVSDFYKTPGPYRDITRDTQRFWRCRHHPEAIANWTHGQGWHCEHGCDTNELRWCDNGTCKPPTS